MKSIIGKSKGMYIGKRNSDYLYTLMGSELTGAYVNSSPKISVNKQHKKMNREKYESSIVCTYHEQTLQLTVVGNFHQSQYRATKNNCTAREMGSVATTDQEFSD